MLETATDTVTSAVISTSSVALHQAVDPVIVSVIQFTIILLFIFVPLVVIVLFCQSWLAYVRGKFFAKQKFVVIELRTPKGIARNLLAMELFITNLYQTSGEGTWYDRLIKGQTRTRFSLEIVSIDGVVRFFIWTNKAYKDLVEAQLYAQFPDIEIKEVDDYTHTIDFDPLKLQYWGCEFGKTGPSHLPIKTYTDFGLDKDAEEEYKIDPITPIIEYLGSMKKGEQLWFQIVIKAHKKEITKPGTWFEKVDWKHAAAEDIKKRTKRDQVTDPLKGNPLKEVLTKGEKEQVEAIERSIGKIPFDVGMRGIYISKGETFRASSIWGLTGLLRQFNVAHLNSFSPRNTTSFDYPWQDITGKKVLKKKRILLERFKHRSFFHADLIPIGYGDRKGDGKPFVMTTEELATVYHFPGDASKTPSLARALAKKVEPPANLPI